MSGEHKTYFFPNIYRLVLPEVSDAGNFKNATELLFPILSKSNTEHSGGSYALSDYTAHVLKISESNVEEIVTAQPIGRYKEVLFRVWQTYSKAGFGPVSKTNRFCPIPFSNLNPDQFQSRSHIRIN